MECIKLTKKTLIKSLEDANFLYKECKEQIETLNLRETFECYTMYINQFEYLSKLKNDENLSSKALEDINNKLFLCTTVIKVVSERLEELAKEYHYAYPMFPKINGEYPY